MGTDDAADDHIPPGSWQPLSARRGGTPIDETWQEGIPPWIDRSVRSWLHIMLIRTHERLFARLHFTGNLVDRDLRRLAHDLNEAELLDWIDGALKVNADGHRDLGLPDSYSRSDTKSLEVLLAEGHSIWKVSDSLDGLERRQDSTVTAAAHRASDTAASSGRTAASERLQNAWRHTYGLHPDPSKAFGEAILAVEAVAVPAITPKEASAHLGHVYGQLRSQSHLYELAITDKTGTPSSVQPVTVLVGLLWSGHTDRHEGNVPAVPITQEAAEMAVHAASTLVHWFATGAVRRKPTQK